MDWYVVNTNPRSEDRAARGLREAGFTCFLPSYGLRVRRRYTTSHRIVPMPLLTGYLFVEMPRRDANWYSLRAVDGVRRVLGADNRSGRIVGVGRAEVEEFMRLCASGIFDHRDPAARPFKAGDRVIVREGPFAGVVVHFDDYTGRKSARLLASIFGRITPVEMDLDAIAPA